MKVFRPHAAKSTAVGINIHNVVSQTDAPARLVMHDDLDVAPISDLHVSGLIIAGESRDIVTA